MIISSKNLNNGKFCKSIKELVRVVGVNNHLGAIINDFFKSPATQKVYDLQSGEDITPDEEL